jgi:hypothetical protein
MNMSIASRRILLILTFVIPGHLLVAQTQPTTLNKTSTSDCIATDASTCDLNATITDIAPPDSPAFSLLGLNPTNVSKPNSPAELASSVLNAFDDNGHFQSGTAVDVVPFLVFKAKSFSLGQYTDRTMNAAATRVLSRSSVSFATTKGTSAPDTAVRLALGFRSSLIDSGDPRAGFQSCVRDINIHLVPPPEDKPTAQPTFADSQNNPVSDDAFKKMFSDCRTKSGDKVWNANSVVVAGALSWISTDGSTSNLKSNGSAFWASAAWNMTTDWAQLIVSGRRQTGQSVVPPNSSSGGTTGNDSFVLQDSTVAGGAVKFGRSGFNGTMTGLYIGKRTGGSPDSYPEFGFGVEKQLSSNLYLELNYRYDVTQKNVSGVLANIKWSFSQQPKLKTH